MAFSLLGLKGWGQALGPTRYSSSVTFSIHSTTLQSFASWMAMWVIAVVGVAPCQWRWFDGQQMMSPVLISSIGPPSHRVQPLPAVTISTCPSGWVCQALRAPGSNVTLAPDTLAPPMPLNGASMRTVPVKYSAGPVTDGGEPLRMISMVVLLLLIERSIDAFHLPACAARCAG